MMTSLMSIEYEAELDAEEELEGGEGDVTVKGTWWVHRVLIRMSFPGLSHVKEHQKLI